LTLKQFANLLTGMMDRPVVNITGADGEFDILFDARIPVANLKPIPVFILPDGRKLGGQRVEPPEAQYITLWDGRKLPGDAPSIFSAIRKLGLSLEPGRAALEYLIIDKVDKTPTEN
jgi:uncharacterized protein (TIGR03435 family)